jgi:cytochrome c oxidase subunit IV
MSDFGSILTSIQSNELTYKDSTNQLNNFNEIYNMNTYVSNINKKEIDRINDYNKTLSTRVLQLKQDYLLKEYKVYNYQFWYNVMYFTIVMSGIGLAVIAFYLTNKEAISFTLVLVFLGVLSLLYLMIIISVLSLKIIRRNNSWNQFYWKSM